MYFEVKIRYEAVAEDAGTKNVSETYAVESNTFTEAESAILKKVVPYISGMWQIVAVKIAPYKEVIAYKNCESADKFYRAKLTLVTIDEKTAREKRSIVTYLVHAESLLDAQRTVEWFMSGTGIVYSQMSIVETPVIDVFQNGSSQ